MRRIGILGLGRIGTVHSLAGLKVIGNMPGWGLAFASGRDEIRRGEWGKGEKNNLGIPVPDQVDVSGMHVYRTADELFADSEVELVVNASGTGLHKDYGIAALRAGKHLLGEKPLARSVADASEMLAEATKAGRHLFCGQILPWIGEFQFAFDRILGSGNFGQNQFPWGPLQSYSVFRHVAWNNPLSLRSNLESSGGPLLDLGVHDFHLIVASMGMPSCVQATGQIEDGVIINARTQCYFGKGKFKGVTVTADCGANLVGSLGFRHGYTIGFAGGSLGFGSDGFPLTFRNTNTNAFDPLTLPADPDGMLGAFTRQLGHAVRMITGEVTDPLGLSGTAARDALAVCAAAEASIQQGGKPIEIAA